MRRFVVIFLVLLCFSLLLIGDSYSASNLSASSVSKNSTRSMLKNSGLYCSAWPPNNWIPWQGSSSLCAKDGMKVSFGRTLPKSNSQQPDSEKLELQPSNFPYVGMELCGSSIRWGGISQEFSVMPGQTVNASGHVGSLLSHDPVSGRIEAWIEVKYMSCRNNEIEKHKSDKITGSTDCLQQLTVSSVAPEGAEKAVFSFCLLGQNGARGTVYFSDAAARTIEGDYTPTAKNLFDKPQSRGRVRISGNKLLVKGKPFVIKGVCYQPTPVGFDVTEYRVYNNPKIYKRDLPLLRSMGANVIRTYAKVTSRKFLDACYNIGFDPIYVIMGFYIDGSADLSNREVLEKIKSDFREYVKRYKRHPAVLMWSPGNETECAYMGSDRDYYTLLNELAEVAYLEEGDTYHPVTAVLADISHIGDRGLLTTDEDMNYLDVWGANAYKGINFGDMFDDYVKRSKKPLWVSEFGVDAWHSVDKTDPSYGYANERLQSVSNCALWDEISSRSDVCSGGAVFEYSDEWWKDRCGNKATHDYRGFAMGDEMLDHPDRYSSEEWYGIVSVSKNGREPDNITPRRAYYALKSRWSDEPEIETCAFIKEVRALIKNLYMSLFFSSPIMSIFFIMSYK